MKLNRDKIVPQLQRLLDKAVADGEECGCQLAIIQDGELIADLSAGYVDEQHQRQVDSQTLFPVFSVGKAIAATAFHRLVEKGIVDYDTRIAELWPEFACRGKEEIRAWQILSHRAGLYEMPTCGDISEQADWELMCERIAAMTPADTPGGKCHYHGVTYAWLLGETARRAAGKCFREIIEEEVLKPAGMNDFFFGTTPEAERRFARLTPNRSEWRTDFIHNPAIRRAFIPSANGVSNAMSLARHYDALLNGHLLKPETLKRATQLCRADDDPIPAEGTWARFGLGYVLYGPENDLSSLFGHGGAAGSEGFADFNNRIALGFSKNKLNSTHPIHPLRDRISQTLGYHIRHW